MFRKYLEEQGNAIGVRGFVRNMDDGRVEVVMEGVDEKVRQMLDVCKAGTKHAIVRSIEVNEIKNQGFEGFKISKL